MLIANDADTPWPFISFISAVPDQNGVHEVLGRIIFDGSYSVTPEGVPIKLPKATNGIEASQYNPATGLFYLDLPQNGANPNVGATVVIDPKTFRVEQVFNIFGCQPTGMAIAEQRGAARLLAGEQRRGDQPAGAGDQPDHRAEARHLPDHRQ